MGIKQCPTLTDMLKGIWWLGWKTFSKARRQIAGSLSSSTGTERMERWRCESWGTRDRADMKRWMRGKGGRSKKNGWGREDKCQRKRGRRMLQRGLAAVWSAQQEAWQRKWKTAILWFQWFVCVNISSVWAVTLYQHPWPAAHWAKARKKKKKASPNPLEWVARRCALHRCVGVRNVHISGLGRVSIQQRSALHSGRSSRRSSTHVRRDSGYIFNTFDWKTKEKSDFNKRPREPDN